MARAIRCTESTARKEGVTSNIVQRSFNLPFLLTFADPNSKKPEFDVWETCTLVSLLLYYVAKIIQRTLIRLQTINSDALGYIPGCKISQTLLRFPSELQIDVMSHC